MSYDGTSTADTITIDHLIKARELFNRQRITKPQYLMQVPEDLLQHAKDVVESCGLTSIIDVKPYLKKPPKITS